MTYQIANPFHARIGDEITVRTSITTGNKVGLDEINHEARKTMLRDLKKNMVDIDDDIVFEWAECPAIPGFKRQPR